PTGASGISNRSHANPEGKTVRRHAVIAGVGIAFACARVNVDVNVNQTGRDVKPRSIDHLESVGRVDPVGHSGYLALYNRQVTDGTGSILGIDQMASTQQQVVLLLGGRPPGKEKAGKSKQAQSDIQ